jgi:hypothetical protein
MLQVNSEISSLKNTLNTIAKNIRLVEININNKINELN